MCSVHARGIHQSIPLNPPPKPNPQVWRRGGGEISENDLFDRRFDVQRANLRNNLLETIPWLRNLLRDINWPDVRTYTCVCLVWHRGVGEGCSLPGSRS